MIVSPAVPFHDDYWLSTPPTTRRRTSRSPNNSAIRWQLWAWNFPIMPVPIILHSFTSLRSTAAFPFPHFKRPLPGFIACVNFPITIIINSLSERKMTRHTLIAEQQPEPHNIFSFSPTPLLSSLHCCWSDRVLYYSTKQIQSPADIKEPTIETSFLFKRPTLYCLCIYMYVSR